MMLFLFLNDELCDLLQIADISSHNSKLWIWNKYKEVI